MANPPSMWIKSARCVIRLARVLSRVERLYMNGVPETRLHSYDCVCCVTGVFICILSKKRSLYKVIEE